MFIKTRDGKLINTRFIYKIDISPYRKGEYECFGVYAHVQMDGAHSLGNFPTREEAEEYMDKYYQMN